MKKGQQVFIDKEDELLTEKIINRTGDNISENEQQNIDSSKKNKGSSMLKNKFVIFSAICFVIIALTLTYILKTKCCLLRKK
jgi:hypothetical protein